MSCVDAPVANHEPIMVGRQLEVKASLLPVVELPEDVPEWDSALQVVAHEPSIYLSDHRFEANILVYSISQGQEI